MAAVAARLAALDERARPFAARLVVWPLPPVFVAFVFSLTSSVVVNYSSYRPCPHALAVYLLGATRCPAGRGRSREIAPLTGAARRRHGGLGLLAVFELHLLPRRARIQIAARAVRALRILRVRAARLEHRGLGRHRQHRGRKLPL
jgi:hypothetical protein